MPSPDDTATILAPDPSHPVVQAMARVLLAISAWLGSVAAADVQIWVSIAGGFSVFVYTSLQIYLLWRDKVRKPPALGGAD
jgi:hypothetical protein